MFKIRREGNLPVAIQKDDIDWIRLHTHWVDGELSTQNVNLTNAADLVARLNAGEDDRNGRLLRQSIHKMLDSDSHDTVFAGIALAAELTPQERKEYHEEITSFTLVEGDVGRAAREFFKY